MTGFGRSGEFFAAHVEEVYPDLVALAKGLTGGYLPLAATLCTEEIYQAFLNTADEDRAFYYGHSYCGNPLGCAVALASLELFEKENTLSRVKQLIPILKQGLKSLAEMPFVKEVRQAGLISGIELCHPDGSNINPLQALGTQVCLTARELSLIHI